MKAIRDAVKLSIKENFWSRTVIKTRYTTDKMTGKRFAWNTTVTLEDGTIAAAYCGARHFVHLHPGRTPANLLKELNSLDSENDDCECDAKDRRTCQQNCKPTR